MWLGELCSTNPLRIPHPKFDKLACQAQGVGIFAKGEITLHIAFLLYHISVGMSIGFLKEKTHSFLSVNLTTHV